MAVIGIDLGTTNSLVSVFQDGRCVLIPNEFKEYLTPSIVNVSGDTVCVGKAAKEKMVTEPQNTARQFKREMGTDKKYSFGNKVFSAEDLSALVLKKLKEDAERFLGEKVEEAVISVPAYFDDKQRSATKRAGELAGLKVERLVNEPSAAALLSKMRYIEEDGNFLIFDFGGGTLDISLVECFQNVVNVIAISGDNKLGGCDFDYAIAAYFCEENQVVYGELDSGSQSSLLFQCEQLKWRLTETESAKTTIEIGNKEYDFELSRKKLVSISKDIFKKIDKIVQRVLLDSGMELAEITEVILVGGSSKMPVVKQYVRYLLGDGAAISQEEPDTIVGLGVGVYAGIKERKAEIKDIVLTDICPFSLGTGVKNSEDEQNPLMSVIIPRNTPLPVSKKQIYVNAHDFQRRIKLDVYQGEGYYAKDNTSLGSMNVEVTPKPREQEAVYVTFSYDINGILLVLVEVPSKERSYEMLIEGRGGLSEAERDQRIRELSALKIDLEKPENMVLLERAQATYEELTGKTQMMLGSLIQHFIHAMSLNRLQRKEYAKQELENFLNELEAHKDYVLEHTFEEDWYQQGEEEE